MRINTNEINEWKVASKVRPIKAKPLASLIVDKSIVTKFLIDTLEGKEPLGNNVVICLGEAMDVWQQTPKKLLQKYTITEISEDGWLHCTPKPDNAVDCYEVNTNNEFYIIGLWGATVGDEKNVQIGKSGDFICRNQTDKSDVWIVNRKLFLNTYVIQS